MVFMFGHVYFIMFSVAKYASHHLVISLFVVTHGLVMLLNSVAVTPCFDLLPEVLHVAHACCLDHCTCFPVCIYFACIFVSFCYHFSWYLFCF